MVQIDELAALIASEMEKYTEEVTEKVKKAVDIVSDEVNEEIKNKIPFTERTHDYVKAFKIKKTFEDKYSKKKIWHVADGQHRLTHLLEFGHAKTGGGRVRAYPHIRFGEELAEKRLEELVKEAIEG